MNKSLVSTLIVEIDEDKSNVVASSLDNVGLILEKQVLLQYIKDME